MDDLDKARDWLLPILYILSESSSRPDLRLDLAKHNDSLVCTAYSMTAKRSYSFEITKADIENGSYISTFRPNAEEIIELLTP